MTEDDILIARAALIAGMSSHEFIRKHGEWTEQANASDEQAAKALDAARKLVSAGTRRSARSQESRKDAADNRQKTTRLGGAFAAKAIVQNESRMQSNSESVEALGDIEIDPRPYDNWSENRRAVPNDLLRSSLFGIGARDPYVKIRPIATSGGARIFFKGMGYDQCHLDVFIAVAHLARGVAPDAEIRTNRNALLKILGRRRGGSGYKWLWERLTDLQVGTLIVHHGVKAKSDGPLLECVEKDDSNGAITIRLNPKMRSLFDMATHLEWPQRSGRKSPLDKWLHAFWSSHTIPYQMKVETYWRLTGSNSSLKEFRRLLKDSMKRLEKAGVLLAGKIVERDHVSVLLPMSKTKIRHLNRAARKRSEKDAKDLDF